MKSFFFSLLWILFLIFSFWPIKTEAQIISLLINSENENDSFTMETEMKKHLEAEGYEVKGATAGEGFFLYVQFLPIQTVGDQLPLRGFVGNVFIGSQAWTKVVDAFMPASCDITLYQKMKNNIGLEMVLIDSSIFADSSIEDLAAIMSTSVNRIIREKSSEMTVLMHTLVQK